MTERMNWTIVPTEPTFDMIEAGNDITRRAYVGRGLESEQADEEDVYTAMLSTTPDPLQDEGLVEKLARAIYEAEPTDEYPWEELLAEDARYPDEETGTYFTLTGSRNRARAVLSILSGKSEKAE